MPEVTIETGRITGESNRGTIDTNRGTIGSWQVTGDSGRITVNPGRSITVDVPSGSLLLDAARKADVSVELPCGGKGVCGRCLVEIKSGRVEFNGKIIEAGSEITAKVMICQAKVLDTPVTFVLPDGLKSEEGKFLNGINDVRNIEKTLLPCEEDIEFFIKKIEINVPKPKMGDGLSDLDRLKKAISAGIPGYTDIKIPLEILRPLPELLRQADGYINVLYYTENQIIYIVDIKPEKSFKVYGAAIDIGTTTAAVLLTDECGSIIAEKTAYNLQAECGLDVISRINYAKNKQRLEELKEKVLKTINSLISDIAKENSIKTSEIYNVSIAANTTMVHLFLGIVPEYIRLDPYTPAVYETPLINAGEAGLLVNPNTVIYIAPSVGSYVGGDITSGILCTQLARNWAAGPAENTSGNTSENSAENTSENTSDNSAANLSANPESIPETTPEDICLFIDIGTNGEIIIGNNDFLLGCACSAGPAFEGGGIKYGMRASGGAIEHVKIDPETGKPTCTVIGNTKAAGICGSGMISLIAGLLENGFLDPDGKLHGKTSEFILTEGKNSYFILAGNERNNSVQSEAGFNDIGSAITVSEADIDNFIRAKAAILSACRVMLKNVSMDFSDLSRIYIAGGFGRYLDIVNSKTIGLFPNIPFEKFRFLGNSSLAGAYMTLLSEKHRQKQAELAGKITYIDLSNEPGYMDEYTAALFLPHTDFSLFE